MGVYDWIGEDTHLNQTTPAMHHSTAMGTCLFSRPLSEEEKVSKVSILF